MKKLRVWPCKDIDFSWSDFVYAVRMCFTSDRIRSEKGRQVVESDGASLLCMSVRAAFDLYLMARKWEHGDECVFIGVNVPDMYRIAESHGLAVRGADIDPITTEVDLLHLRACINSNTRFLVVPHLYGHRLDLRAVVDLASRHGLDVVEDCAQAFAGKCWWGTQGVTLSLFSFGPMKTATALQGAVAIVRDKGLFEIMDRKLRTYPVQPTWRYFLRVVRFSAMKIATRPLIYGLFVRVLTTFRLNHEAVVHASTKSTSGVAFQLWLRARPCRALKRVIERRIGTSETGIQLRLSKGQALTRALDDLVPLVLRNCQPNTFWMVPVLVDDVKSFKSALRSEGFDAMSGRLVAIESAKTNGAAKLDNAVMLPFSTRMSDEELHRLGVATTNFHLAATESVGTDNRD